MRPYELFSIQDFIADDAFIAWVVFPTQASNSFWLDWVQKHPYKRAEVEEAVKIVRHLPSQPDVFSEEEVQQCWKSIQKRIAPETRKRLAGIAIPRWRRWYTIVAAVLMGIAFWWVTQQILH